MADQLCPMGLDNTLPPQTQSYSNTAQQTQHSGSFVILC